MSSSLKLLTEYEKNLYYSINKESIDFVRFRYNKTNRWVVADIVKRISRRYPNKTAVIYNNEKLTYKELDEKCNQVANALKDLGIQKYDRIAVLAHNTIHHLLSWFGAIKIGAIYVPINHLLRGREIQYCINHSESKAFIIEDSLYDLVKDVISEMKTVKHFIWANEKSTNQPPAIFYDFDEWYKTYSKDEPDEILSIEDPCQLSYTSGTESLPKAVLMSNQGLLSQYVSCIIDGEYKKDDICINALPISHTAQRDVFLNPIFYIGGTNILMGADVKDILENIEKYRATCFFAPPTIWISILRHPDFNKYNLQSLDKCYYGASIMPIEILKELLDRLHNVKIYNYYGQTELAPAHTILKSEDALKKLGSAGKAILNMETILEDMIKNTPITKPNISGEICGRGPHVMTMYYKDPEKTEEAMKNGWFHSGDIGILDEDGYISVVDRKKDMIKTGGENVSSREVEEIIYKNPRVKEVAVVGIPHQKWIEAVTAIVVLKNGETATEEEIINMCRKELAPFKVPKRVIFIRDLPRTPSGKILKRDLRLKYKDLFANNSWDQVSLDQMS